MDEVNALLDRVITKQEGETILASGQYAAKTTAAFKKQFYIQTFVSITIAFEPSRQFLSSVQRWFEANLGQRVILDLVIDEGIVGGAIIVCNDHYKDYSIVRDFSKYSEQRSAIQP